MLFPKLVLTLWLAKFVSIPFSLSFMETWYVSTNVLSYCNHNTFVLGISFFLFLFFFYKSTLIELQLVYRIVLGTVTCICHYSTGDINLIERTSYFSSIYIYIYMWYSNLIDCVMCVDMWCVPHKVFTRYIWILLTTTRSLNYD